MNKLGILGWAGILGILASALQFLDFFECKPWNEKSVCYWGERKSTKDTPPIQKISITPHKQIRDPVAADFGNRRRPFSNQLRDIEHRNDNIPSTKTQVISVSPTVVIQQLPNRSIKTESSWRQDRYRNDVEPSRIHYERSRVNKDRQMYVATQRIEDARRIAREAKQRAKHARRRAEAIKRRFSEY